MIGMSLARDEKGEWDLPHLKEIIEVDDRECTDIYDVKFYPYTKPAVDPIFAVVGVKHILICRPNQDKTRSLDVIKAIRDEDDNPQNSSLAWTKDREGVPLLCVAGGNAKIKIIDALTGELRRTLIGHGGEINDLAISPTNPEILASVSADATVRLWSLHPAHEQRPCFVLCAGEGHKESLLSVAFNRNGRYILSGGQDHVVNLWTIPDIPDPQTVIKRPTVIHYPHFSTSDVHSNIVDCVAFHHDLILSKAFQENCIVLWSITGFSSEVPLPEPSSAPTSHDPLKTTRSAFVTKSSGSDDSSEPLYTRLLQFDLPDSDVSFYMRFSLFTPFPSDPPPLYDHAVLAAANSRSKVFFWDLSRLVEYHSFMRTTDSDGSNSAKRPHWLSPMRTRGSPKKNRFTHLRESSPTESVTSTMTSSSVSAAEMTANREMWDKKYAMGMGAGGKLRLAAHKEESISRFAVTARQVAWSVGGEWCVVAGTPNILAVFQRWGPDGRRRP